MTEYGKNLKIKIYGGSHDEYIGVIAEGIPAGIKIDCESLSKLMERRAPGRSRYSTRRHEPDIPEFISGVDCGMTNGTPFHAVIRSIDQHSADYKSTAGIPRPSHADYAAYIKFKVRGETVDLRGGGHFSGRLTAPLCIIGGILKDELARRGILIGAHIYSIAGIPDKPFDPVNVGKSDFDLILSHSFPVIDESCGCLMQNKIDDARAELDSVGGVIECAVCGLPVGMGEHMFGGIESRISQIVFSVPAVKGVEFGSGFAGSALKGSENNDPFVTDGNKISTVTNNSGGIQGGMTNGMPIIFRAAVKPTPSIGRAQDSVDLTKMKNVKLEINGRHDPCIVPRATPVIEAAAAIAIFDILLDEGEPEI